MRITHKLNKQTILFSLAGILILTCVSTSSATQLAKFSTSNGWTEFAADDTTNQYFVDPGYGGQAFDAEYLYYQLNGTKLSIALQTGFDIETGKVRTGGKDYFAGDLALSFDSTPETFEYAIDFGLLTKDYDNQAVGGDNNIRPSTPGTDDAGLYAVSTWNNNIYFPQSAPFAMEDGDLIQSISYGVNDIGKTLDSYWRISTIDLTSIPGLVGNAFTLGASWTMSCGNDLIRGTADVAPVPEPATMLLFGTGLVGLAGITRRRKTNL